jgi:small subunit ribosomal protein S11e
LFAINSIPKYRRYEKRHKNLAAHCSPAFRVSAGDQVIVGQCRPLSKTVRFNVLRGESRVVFERSWMKEEHGTD